MYQLNRVSAAVSAVILVHLPCHLAFLILLYSSTYILSPAVIIRCPSHTMPYLCIYSYLLLYISACIYDVCFCPSRSHVSAAGALPSCAPRSVPAAFPIGRGVLRSNRGGGVRFLTFLVRYNNSPPMVSSPLNVPGFW